MFTSVLITWRIDESLDYDVPRWVELSAGKICVEA